MNGTGSESVHIEEKIVFTLLPVKNFLVTCHEALDCWQNTDSLEVQTQGPERSWTRRRSSQTLEGPKVRRGHQAPRKQI